MKLNLPKRKIFSGPALIWKRIIAFIIDIIILELILFSPFNRIVERLIGSTSFSFSNYDYLMNSPEKMQIILSITVFATILAILYFSILEYKILQTPGKILMGIYIASQTKTLKYWQCLVRTLFIIPIFPFIILWIIDPLYALFNQNNQRLFEVLSKTKTVENFVAV